MTSTAQLFQAAIYMIIGIATQVVGVSLLPRTLGFTDPKWTILSIITFSCSLYMVALLIHKGYALSIVVPLMSAMLPLVICVVSFAVLGEPASLRKVIPLVAACGLIGVAAFSR